MTVNLKSIARTGSSIRNRVARGGFDLWGDTLGSGLAVLVLAWLGVRVVVARLGKTPAAHTFELWAFAAMAVGAFVGFLFGIPRVLQHDDAPAPAPPTTPGNGTTTVVVPRAGATTTHRVYQQRVNTNLEQISDWLTKILVGIGLVQLGSVPERVRTAAEALGRALTPASTSGGAAAAPPPDALALAAGVVVYFPVLGFMGGYLMTRLFLSGAFSRADQRAQATLRVGDEDLTLEEAADQSQSALADLQEQVARLIATSARPAGAAVAGPGTEAPRGEDAIATGPETAAEEPPDRTPPPRAEALPDTPGDTTGERTAPRISDRELERSAERASKPPARGAAEGEAPPRARSVLWVDDNPRNNASQMESLRRQGFIVTPALSTKEAIDRLDRGERYDAFVTDWFREEDGQPVREAGLELLRALQARGLGPTFVYAGRAAHDPRVRALARKAGAQLGTASATELLAALQKV